MATNQPIIGYLFQVIFYHQPQKNFSLVIKPIPPFSKKAADDPVKYLRDKITRVLADYLYLAHPLVSDHPNHQYMYIPDQQTPEDLLKLFWDPTTYYTQIFTLPHEGPLKEITHLLKAKSNKVTQRTIAKQTDTK
jgi:hypothetical protein